MRPTVEIGFDLSLAGAGDFFTLDDPVKGELDGSAVLAGDVLTDVSDYVRSVQVRRGRSTETTAVDAASATIALDNRTRLFDPTAAASVSPYGPSILPRKEIKVSMAGAALFTGQVEDWDLEYSMSGDSVTFAKASDGFALLAQQMLASGAGFTGLSSSAIYLTASAAGWPIGRMRLDEGTTDVGAHTVEDRTVVLPYLQKIANQESGLLFMGKNANLTFRDRISPRVDFGTRFADDGTGVPFSNIEIQYGSEFLSTVIEVRYLPDLTWTSTAASTSIVNYGESTYTVDTFLPDAGSASVAAEFWAERYGDPTFRITGVEVQFDALTGSQKAQVLALELGHGVDVVFTPNGIGSPISRDLAIDSIEHDITPSAHMVRFGLFEPFLMHRSGSVDGVSSTAAEVVGNVGFYGYVEGASATAGTVLGSVGYFGSAEGSSGTAGSVTGIKSVSFILDTSQLDSGILA